MEVFKNPEFKKFSLKLLAISLIFFLGLNIITYINLKNISNDIVKSQQGFIGRFYSSNPDLDTSPVSSFLYPPSSNEVEIGKNILKDYGFDKNMDISLNPFFHKSLTKIFTSLNAFLVFVITILTVLIYLTLKEIYNFINKVSYAAEKVVEGDFSNRINENMEGDLGRLGLEFNKLNSIVKDNLEKLKKEKIFLQTTMTDISHQLKTPMTSLIMLNDLMIDGSNMKPEIREDFLTKCSLQLKRMDFLIKSLLKLARIEAGSIDFKKINMDLKEIVLGASNALKPTIEMKNQSISINGQGFFIGDKEWTLEAIINVLKNCLEHSPENSCIDISIYGTNVYSEIIIKDKGEGITPKDLPHIFERFYKGSTSSKSDSIGIGLAMSKSIIESQGGYIKVESLKDVGSTFTITFLKAII